MQFSPLLVQLIEALRCLPGVGPKTAQRMAFHLLTRARDNGKQLAQQLSQAMELIGHCRDCRIFAETELCEICTAKHRDSSVICIVENPMDAAAIEQTNIFRGKYFVLLGHLSPLDGIGPEQIGIPKLRSQFEKDNIKEIILATNTTVEGEATAHYISELAKPFSIKVTRIARGISIGSELEYSDVSTLAHALSVREVI